MHWSVSVSRSGEPDVWRLHVPIFVPCFFVFTLMQTKLPHAELVPLPFTRTLPKRSQAPASWIFLCFRSAAAHPSACWFTHSPSMKVHFLPLAVWHSVAPSVTAPPLCCMNR